MRQLRLQDISGVAGTPELMVQLVRSMPLLQELHLSGIHAPMLDRVSDLQLRCMCAHHGWPASNLRANLAARTPWRPF